jgi:integrase
MSRRSTTDNTAVTVAAAAERYLTLRRGQVAKDTWINDRSQVTRFVKALGHVPLNRLTQEQVEDFFLSDTGVVTMAPSSFNKTRSRIKCFLDYCIRRGWLAGDLLAEVRPRRVPRKQRLCLSPSELLGMLDLTADPRERAMLAVGMNTALRAGEIADLRVGDVDLDSGYLSVRITKNRTEDAMPITRELDAELRRWLTSYQCELGRMLGAEDYLFPARKPGHWRGPGELVPTTKATLQMPDGRTYVYGTPLPSHRFNKPATVVQRALRRQGHVIGTGEGFHTLRRSVARAFYESRRADGHEYALRETSALLHHSGSHITEHYLGLDPERRRRDTALRGQAFLTAMVHRDNVIELRRSKGTP